MHLNFITHVVISISLSLIRFRTVMLGVILACTVRFRISVPSLLIFPSVWRVQVQAELGPNDNYSLFL